jgi:triacylglycerol lipase
MTAQEARSHSDKRSHIILIPGFAGFDVLGQLEYYGCVTTRFEKFKSGSEVLHYFDNFPTAAVVTRAKRLREYLIKRIARGEIFDNDEITLIGHSTGGLDIRCLLRELKRQNRPVLVDGGVPVMPIKLFKQIRRVVFLSVPHWGTNIADWVQEHWVVRKALIEDLRATVAGSQLSPLERIESAIAGDTASLTGAALFEAVQDALDEANEDNGEQSSYRRAEAHEAASELALYLRQMASDFRAIDDLTSRPPRGRKRTNGEFISPAHFSAEERESEQDQLRSIEFRSYVTIGKRAFRFDPGGPAPTWELTKPWTYPEISKDTASSVGTDWVYRACYRACAGGPFEPPRESRAQARRLSPRNPIETWDNDGIVNTLSMFWPMGEHVLVHADHMDIVGQYKPQPADPGGGRKSRTYDLLKSDSTFDDNVFTEIWNDIFAFALGRSGAHRISAASAGRG